MNLLDGTYDGGGDGADDSYYDERDQYEEGSGGQAYDGDGDDDFERVIHHHDEFPQSEYGQHEDDAGDFESHQLGLDAGYDDV